MIVQTQVNIKDKLSQDFDLLKSRFVSNEKIFSVREKALKDFEEMGFPTTKNEEWKYTNTVSLLKKEYQTLHTPQNSNFDINKVLIPTLKSHVLVFENGQFNESLSEILEDEIVISTLVEATENHPQIVEKHFGQHTPKNTNGYVESNIALAENGAFVWLKKGKAATFPITIVHLSNTRESAVYAQAHHLFVLEENSQCTVIERSIKVGENDDFSNILAEGFIDKNSIFNYFKIQDEVAQSTQINTSNLHQESNSVINTFTFTTEGEFTRNDLNFRVNNQHIETNLSGLYLLNGKQLADNHTFVDHAFANCNSNELYKGIMGGSSKGVFNGKILVREDAQKINAFQSNRNVLVSDNANIYTKPQLEIFADDVRCSHGATTGQVNEDALFYMRARGLSEATARAFLLQGFCSEVLSLISNDTIREYCTELILDKLKRL